MTTPTERRETPMIETRHRMYYQRRQYDRACRSTCN